MIQLNFFLTSLLESPLGQLFLNVQRSTVHHPFSTIYISTAYALLLLLSPSILHLSISHSGSLPLPKSPTTRTSNYCLTLYLLQGVLPQVPRDIKMLIYPSNHQLYLMRHKHQLQVPHDHKISSMPSAERELSKSSLQPTLQ